MINHKRHLCPWKAPELVAQELIKRFGEEGLIWLDGDGSNLGRWAILAANPIKQSCCRGLPSERNSKNPFTILRQLKSGYWIGWLSYEAGAWIEPNNSWKRDEIATLWIAQYDPILRFDLQRSELWIESQNLNHLQDYRDWLEEIPSHTWKQNDNMQAKAMSSNPTINIPLQEWKWLISNDEYVKKVEKIMQWIADGDIFQANLTSCCTTELSNDISASSIFQKLRTKTPAPFAGLVIGAGMAKGEAIISSSPELFLQALPDGQVQTRPIKGTRPRKKNKVKDLDMAIDLVCSTKDRAENIMIVDLLRNDLGKVCNPGSINVSKLLGLESFSHVHHLTSVVKGHLKKEKTWVDLLEACWPGGSISGAPKLRACQRLHELEPMPRGPYCGSVLSLDWNGKLDSNILIRSLILKCNTLRAHAGCGIVADSNPYEEAKELKWKLLPLLKALQ